MQHAKEIFQREILDTRAIVSSALIKKNSHLLEQYPNSDKRK